MKNIHGNERECGRKPEQSSAPFSAMSQRFERDTDSSSPYAPLLARHPSVPGRSVRNRLDSRLEIVDCLDRDFLDEFRKNVRQGLSRPQKAIPAKYFYDEKGSRLFERICRLPEYYPTRMEISILERCAPQIMAFFSGERGDLVEIGCGSNAKVRRLLEAAGPEALAHIRYVPMDISGDFLRHSAARLLRDYPSLTICGLVADFTRHLAHLPPGRRLIAFFGGTFGNFNNVQGLRLLRQFAGLMGPRDRLLIGLDMVKPVPVLEAAYNDSAGVTARFNRNILSHVNRCLKAEFDPDDFAHRAFFNRDLERIEMHLAARRKLRVGIADLGMRVEMEKGETIHTEISRKFSRISAEDLFREAGVCVSAWHADERGWFSLVELRKACSG